MKKFICVTALALLFHGVCPAQSTLPAAALPTVDKDNPDNLKKASLPLWLQELSNLPAGQRKLYTESFARAKMAYAAAKLAECESHLNTCEMIYRGNPNVWSLRASLLIAQRRFDEAEPLMEKVIREQPEDAITIFNRSLLSLGRGEYERCVQQTSELLENVRYTESMQLQHSLKFRLLLAYLMLGEKEKAESLVADVSPLDDSPLYYYAQAAFAIYRGDVSQAAREVSTADRIYIGEKYLLSYKQNLSFSKLQDKYLNK